MRDNVKVIIARFAEDVSWVPQLGLDCVIYDKQGDLRDNAIQLENIGREAHTYLSHIITNYDRLAAYNVFLQGSPFDHLVPTGDGSVSILKKRIEDVVDIGLAYAGLSYLMIVCDCLGRPHDLNDPARKGRWPGWGRDIPVGEVFEQLFSVPAPEQFVVKGAAGLFAVRRERILARPKAFYERALRLVLADPLDERNTGHAFERLWESIFNGNQAWNRLEDEAS